MKKEWRRVYLKLSLCKMKMIRINKLKNLMMIIIKIFINILNTINILIWTKCLKLLGVTVKIIPKDLLVNVDVKDITNIIITITTKNKMMIWIWWGWFSLWFKCRCFLKWWKISLQCKLQKLIKEKKYKMTIHIKVNWKI